MSEKKLKISLDIDDKAFTAAVKRMQQQLQQIQSPANLMQMQRQIDQKARSMGLGGFGAAPTEAQIQREQQKSKQESEKTFQEASRRLSQIQKLQKDLNAEEVRGFANDARKKTVLEGIVRLKQEEYDLTAKGALLVGGPGGGRGGGRGPISGGGDMVNMTKSILGAMGISAGISGLVSLGKEVYTSYVSAPSQINLATGSAIRNTLGYQDKNLLSGDVASATLLQNQMGKGRNLAEQEYDKRLSTIFSPTRLLSNVLGKANFPGAEKAGSYFRDIFESGRAKEVSGNTLEQAQALLDQNPNLQKANALFQQTFDRNLGAERSFGLGTDQFRKMQMGVTGAGFSTDQAVGMLGQIQGAGGSASGANAQGMANLGLGAQRGFNLTNAGNVLGKLTGVYGPGGGQQVDETTKRILQENIAKGFDKSENTELLRKFTETSADIIYKGEAKAPEDVDRLTRSLSQLLSPDASMKQFEAAKGAYQEYQGATSETSGRGGSLGMAAFAGSGKFSKLQPMDIGNLMEIPEGQITTTNSDIIALAKKQGVSPQEMVNNILQAKKTQALSTVGLSEKQLAPLQKYLGGRDIGEIQGSAAELNKMEKESPAAYKAYDELRQRAHLSGKYESDEMQKERVKQLYQGPAGEMYGPTPSTEEAGKRVKAGMAGKKEEEYLALQSGVEKEFTKNLKALENQLYPTKDAIVGLTKSLLGIGGALEVLDSKAKALGAYNAAPLGPISTKDSMGKTPSNGSKPAGK